jgi:hypothetical protein
LVDIDLNGLVILSQPLSGNLQQLSVGQLLNQALTVVNPQALGLLRVSQ